MGEERAIGAGRRDLDAWLQDRVAGDDRPCFRIELGAIEGMRQRSDEPAGAVSRQHGVCIQRDDIGCVGQRVDVLVGRRGSSFLCCRREGD